MYVRRKVFSILVDEVGEERLYSVNETILEGYEEREFAEKEEEKEFTSVRHFKKALNTGLEKTVKGNLTNKDIARLIRTGKFAEGTSPKSIYNPNFEKVAKGYYNKSNKLLKGGLEKVSKPEFVNQIRKDLGEILK